MSITDHHRFARRHVNGRRPWRPAAEAKAAERQAAVTAALDRLHDRLVRAFSGEDWPSRLILPAPLDDAETAALDAFIAWLRADLPDLVVEVRGD